MYPWPRAQGIHGARGPWRDAGPARHGPDSLCSAQVGVWNSNSGLNMTDGRGDRARHGGDSLANRTLVVTTILVSGPRRARRLARCLRPESCPGLTGSSLPSPRRRLWPPRPGSGEHTEPREGSER